MTCPACRWCATVGPRGSKVAALAASTHAVAVPITASQMGQVVSRLQWLMAQDLYGSFVEYGTPKNGANNEPFKWLINKNVIHWGYISLLFQSMTNKLEGSEWCQINHPLWHQIAPCLIFCQPSLVTFWQFQWCRHGGCWGLTVNSVHLWWSTVVMAADRCWYEQPAMTSTQGRHHQPLGE